MQGLLIKPVGFTPGLTGQLFQQFAVTISVSVLLSSINALTLSPALCATFLRPPRAVTRGPLAWFEKVLTVSRDGYSAGVRRLVRLTMISVAVFVALALSDVLGWADGVMGLCVAIFTVQQGVTQVVEAREKMNGSFFSPASDGSMGKLPIHDESARLIPDPIRQAGGTGAAAGGR